MIIDYCRHRLLCTQFFITLFTILYSTIYVYALGWKNIHVLWATVHNIWVWFGPQFTIFDTHFCRAPLEIDTHESDVDSSQLRWFVSVQERIVHVRALERPDTPALGGYTRACTIGRQRGLQRVGGVYTGMHLCVCPRPCMHARVIAHVWGDCKRHFVCGESCVLTVGV